MYHSVVLPGLLVAFWPDECGWHEWVVRCVRVSLWLEVTSRLAERSRRLVVRLVFALMVGVLGLCRDLGPDLDHALFALVHALVFAVCLGALARVLLLLWRCRRQ